jgi:hypothetical protein
VKKPGLLASSFWFLVAAGGAAAATTPTPTPRPKLSGGFGRPRATPVAPAATEGGQSLADVVRAAQEGRGTSSGEKEKSGVTIDNKSLVKDAGKGRLTTSTMAASSPPKAPAPTPAAAPAASVAAAGGNGDAADAPAAEAGGEAEWREIARRDRKRVDDAKARVAELTATSKKLENDFYAWDDGQYRDRVIKPSWDRAKADLDQARIELENAEKELADLPERARKAGALPGWIRE